MNAAVFRAFAAAAAIATTLGSAVVVWAIVFEDPWLEYPVIPFPVLLPAVHAGEVIPLSVRRCNTGTTTRAYVFAHSLVSVDGAQTEVVLPPVTASVSPGCSTAQSRVNIVPRGTKPGIYRINGVTEINGIVRSFPLQWESEPFEVLP